MFLIPRGNRARNDEHEGVNREKMRRNHGIASGRESQPRPCLWTAILSACRNPPPRLYDDALMNIAHKSSFVLSSRHLLGIEGLSRDDIVGLLDLAGEFVELNRQIEKKTASLRGRTLINMFFEASTRTQASFELALVSSFTSPGLMRPCVSSIE